MIHGLTRLQDDGVWAMVYTLLSSHTTCTAVYGYTRNIL
jgi:hypothetical protein